MAAFPLRICSLARQYLGQISGWCRLVFESPVQSGYLNAFGATETRDWLDLFQNLKITGPN